jgi:signal transduction histidine kinase
MARPDDLSALILADRLACLGTLVAGLAHELNNPISYVQGNLVELERLSGAMRETLLAYRRRLQSLPDGPEQVREIEAKLEEAGGLSTLEEIVCDALEGAGRVRDLVRDVLALCHDADPSHEGVDPHDVLDSSLRLVSRRLGPVARLHRDYAATREVNADRTRLGQVVLNLLTNSIDACAPGERDQEVITVRTEDVENGVAIEIEDSGAGVPPELHDRVFEPFFTTKRVGEGTGLGLHISRRIVESHGGTLDFRPRPGGGTTFRVVLPARSVEDDPARAD